LREKEIVFAGHLVPGHCPFTTSIIFAQNRSARRQPGATPNERPPALFPTQRVPLQLLWVRGDIAEALSVIQSNYIDGKKLDYNNIFKSSINAC